MGDGCGHCGEVVTAHLTAVDSEGRALFIDYAVDSQPGVQMMHPELEAWRGIVEPLFAAGDEYGQRGHGVRVREVQAEQLSARDWERIKPVLDTARDHLSPLGEPRMDCEDCGAPVLHANGLRVALGDNAPKGSGWRLLHAQLYEIQTWLEDAPHS